MLGFRKIYPFLNPFVLVLIWLFLSPVLLTDLRPTKFKDTFNAICPENYWLRQFYLRSLVFIYVGAIWVNLAEQLITICKLGYIGEYCLWNVAQIYWTKCSTHSLWSSTLPEPSCALPLPSFALLYPIMHAKQTQFGVQFEKESLDLGKISHSSIRVI